VKIPFLIGRFVFGGYFLWSGIHHFAQKKSMAQYANSKNVPMPEVAVQMTGAALILGGASILLGVKPKLGAAAVAGFLAGVSPVMHDFWKQENQEKQQQEMIQFTKNMALLGGALALMGMEEPWPVSVPVGQPSKFEQIKRSARQLIAA
jgi:putative oxidoreductase